MKERTIYQNNFQLQTIYEIKSLLSHVYHILNSYKVDLKHFDNIVRIEDFKKYDHKLVKESLNDSRLFGNQNNNIYLKRVHSYTYETDYDIYENRFIVFLVKYLKETLLEYCYRKQSIKLPFLNTGISYGEFGTYSLLKKYSLDTLNNNFNDSIDEFSNLIGVINNLLKKDFFNKIKPLNSNQIYPTNLLVQDQNYSFCYFFYLDMMRNNLEVNNKFKLSLKNKLKELQRNSFLTTSDGFKFKKDDFLFIFKESEYGYKLIIQNELVLSLHEYDLKLDVNLFLVKLVIINDQKNYNFMINNLEKVIEIIYSLTSIFKKSPLICPICGEELLTDNNYCHICHAKWDNLINSDVVWVFNPYEISKEVVYE